MVKARQLLMLLLAALMMAACSTKKNTSGTRFYHSMAARFNIMYNGEVAYLEGVEAQEKGHQDDYTRLIPMFVQTNKNTAKLGSGNYETAITKCEKAIKLHSIKKKPQTNSSKKKSAKEKEYLQRKEFNPYLKNSWLLMGKAQFNKGEYIEAASTFNYILRLYATQPEVYSVAKAWLARCYVALEWPYDAEDVLTKMKRDSVTIEGQRERDASQAAFYIETQQYAQAIPLLKETIKHTKHKLQRSRLNFLLGQIYMELDDGDNAYKCFSKVIRSNPPYELEFNARIRQTEVLSKGQNKKMIKKLQRMAKNDKNKDYLDQVYYAIGNIHLSVGDTLRCIGAYEKGVEESTKGGIAKAVLLLRLSQLYWEREEYVDAQRTYQQCVAILDKEHEEYAETERRSKALDEAAPHIGTVELQDSLQALAKMPEKEYLAAIDRVIEALKKKEKEEAKKAAANGTTPTANNAANQQNATQRKPTSAGTTGSGQKGAWYFYNPTTVQSGKQEFQRKWGKRENEDNWRRKNKQVSSDGGFEEYNYDEETDSLSSGGQELSEEEQKLRDSLANDPHHREYYLAQIPFTDEQMDASNQLLSEGLYKGGKAVMEKIQNYPYALKMLLRLLNDFPDYDADSRADAYYNLFLLYGRMENQEKAEEYRKLLVDSFPENKKAILVSNPNYEMIARNGKHIEDSLYAATYELYRANQYDSVGVNYEYHTQNFPEGKHRSRIMFVQAMSLLYSGHRTEFMDLLKELIKDYGKDEIAELAGSIVKGVESGRLLSDSKYDSNDIWKRRKTGTAEGDSVQADTLSDDRYCTFNFVLAYPTKSLDEDQLLYEMARYNFTSYMVRNFEIEVADNEGLTMMCIKGFLSYDEVHAYAQRLYGDPHMAKVLQGIRTLLISEDNLKLIGTSFSFDDYKDFYEQKFAPLDIPEDLIIDEPTELEVNDEDYVEPEKDKEEGADSDDDFPFGF